MKASEIIGKEVLDAGAVKVGKVADFDVDIPGKTVNNLTIKVGLTRKHVIQLDDIEKIGDRIILRIKAADLK